jgi:hypothetical protein
MNTLRGRFRRIVTQLDEQHAVAERGEGEGA